MCERFSFGFGSQTREVESARAGGMAGSLACVFAALPHFGPQAVEFYFFSIDKILIFPSYPML